MRTPHTVETSVALSIGRLALLVVSLAGLFAMHGMSEHGVAGPAMESMSVHAVSDGSAMRETAATAVDAKRVTHAVLPGLAHDMGAMALCLAIFGVGVLLWQLRAAGWRTRWLRQIRARATRFAWRARAPDPPDLYRLSIQRC